MLYVAEPRKREVNYQNYPVELDLQRLINDIPDCRGWRRNVCDITQTGRLRCGSKTVLKFKGIISSVEMSRESGKRLFLRLKTDLCSSVDRYSNATAGEVLMSESAFDQCMGVHS